MKPEPVLKNAPAPPELVAESQNPTRGPVQGLILAGGPWDSWFDDHSPSDGFLNDRDQPAEKARESL